MTETPQQTFDRLMKHKGGRFNTEPVDPAFFTDMMFEAERTLAVQFLTSMKEKAASDIHFDYVQSNDLNAVAFIDPANGREFIGVSHADGLGSRDPRSSQAAFLLY